MTTEPQRLQYLEAMGLTAWVARYRLPNAKESEACEWTLPERPAPSPPAERLHALLDETEAAQRQAPAPPPAIETPRAKPPRRARQLLGIEPEGEANESPADMTATSGDTSSSGAQDTAEVGEAQEPLRFMLQVTCLAGRWLIFVPQQMPPEPSQAELLANLLKAAALDVLQPQDFEPYRWPPMEGLSAEAPLEEAREGLRAFIEGTRRRGWSPERVLIFGQEPTLERLVGAPQESVEWLGLPCWQGPSLGGLAQSAEAKRDLWPTLLEWRRAWSTPGESDG